MPGNILDVARQAGVSHTTVSRILRNADGFSYAADTRERVMAAARDLGYVPNPAARFMRLKKTRLIGITTQPQNAYATYSLIEKLSLRIRELGYTPVMVDLNASVPAAGGFLDVGHLAGAICMYAKHERELVARCAGLPRPLPLVTIRRRVTAGPGVRMVTTDNVSGLTQAFRHLYDLGHRRIGFLGYSESDPCRQAAFPVLCRQYGLAPRWFTVPVRPENNPFASAVQMARAVSGRRGGVTALLCEDDEFAAGAIAGLGDLGLKIPQDVSVVGFDDLPLAAAVRPRLTTVGVKIDEKADAAARLLVAWIDGTDVQRELLPESIILEADLIVRDSTAKPPARKQTHAE